MTRRSAVVVYLNAMETEIEAKFLDIDPDEIRAKLRALGGVLVHPERLMRRCVFDFDDNRLDAVGAWVRVRDEGDRVTMSFKQQNDDTLHGTKDITVTVGNFEKACEFLTMTGLVQKSCQETKRETWTIGDVEVVIDTWPWIPTFIEVESANEASLRSLVDRLGLSMRHARHGGVASGVYQQYYEIDAPTINHHPEIRFSLDPPWKQRQRR